MLTIETIVAIYRQYDIDLTEENAVEDLNHVAAFNVSDDRAEELIHGYAFELRREWDAACAQAAAWESER